MRRPLQGLINIVRFNWPFYIGAFGALLSIQLTSLNAPTTLHLPLDLATVVIAVPVLLSLLASAYIYDFSSLYKLRWLPSIKNGAANIVNIHAGFDETSVILAHKYPGAALSVFDFYDAKTHTEPSIRRAREAYPAYRDTKSISTSFALTDTAFADLVVVAFAAHEIRQPEERTAFFQCVAKIVKPDGCIVVAEHTRDIPNFLAYSVGCFHFYSRDNWVKTFASAGLKITKEIKHTPFVTIFTLQYNGITA
jgi:SAM-dependent methyltransferase